MVASRPHEADERLLLRVLEMTADGALVWRQAGEGQYRASWVEGETLQLSATRGETLILHWGAKTWASDRCTATDRADLRHLTDQVRRSQRSRTFTLRLLKHYFAIAWILGRHPG